MDQEKSKKSVLKIRIDSDLYLSFIKILKKQNDKQKYIIDESVKEYILKH